MHHQIRPILNTLRARPRRQARVATSSTTCLLLGRPLVVRQFTLNLSGLLSIGPHRGSPVQRWPSPTSPRGPAAPSPPAPSARPCDSAPRGCLPDRPPACVWLIPGSCHRGCGTLVRRSRSALIRRPVVLHARCRLALKVLFGDAGNQASGRWPPGGSDPGVVLCWDRAAAGGVRGAVAVA